MDSRSLDTVAALATPTALALALAWNFAVLTSVQLSVRLIKAYSPRATAIAAVLLSAATVPITMLYAAWLRPGLWWLAASMLVTGAVGWVVAGRVLRFRRRRSVLVAATGVGVLSAPWGAFLV